MMDVMGCSKMATSFITPASTPVMPSPTSHAKPYSPAWATALLGALLGPTRVDRVDFREDGVVQLLVDSGSASHGFAG